MSEKVNQTVQDFLSVCSECACRRVEDLQFQIEEEVICKDDLEVSTNVFFFLTSGPLSSICIYFKNIFIE